MSAIALSNKVAANFAAPPARRISDWARSHGFNEFRRPYDEFAYPHLGAPGGPFDAVDSGLYFDIWLQWASRLGKTYGGQVVMLARADKLPCPMMLAAPDEKLAVEIAERTKKMAEFSGRENLRLIGDRQDRISFPLCRANLAWARSVSTLADKSVQFGQAAEIDKWEHEKTSGEADPLKLFDDRCKDFITFLRWKDSTPGLKQASRIERGRLGSCNAAFYVPCPKCGRHQTLSLGDGKQERGCLAWEKNAAGKSDKDVARRTAVYICLYCGEALRDEHRGAMMRGGVWVPEGCTVDDDWARECAATWREPGQPLWTGWKSSPWIIGTPMRDGRDWGSQLSSLYALSRSWGDIAAEFIDSKERPQNLRNFKNQWLAETWETAGRETTEEQLGKRIIGTDPRGVVPAWASILTCGVDRQGEIDDRFPWVVDAWGPGQRCATIAYGQAMTMDDLLAMLLQPWPHADKGPPLKIAFSLFDSGYRPKGIHEFCIKAKGLGVSIAASKGSNTSLQCDFKATMLGEGTSAPDQPHFMVDTIRTQLWIEHQLERKSKEDPDGYSLFAGSLLEHQDFLTQLLNDAAIHDLDTSNNVREKWERRDENIPNDFRDCRRYAYIAMLAHTRGGAIPSRLILRGAPAPQPRQEDKSRVRRMEFRRR